MFKNFESFICCIESLPHQQLDDQQMQARLLKGRAFVDAHGLQPKAPVITVTGTNGKGSTVQALSEILAYHGLNVFAFTSPHLLSYTERFAYNLQFVEEEVVLRLANQLSTLIDFSEWNFFFILFFISLLLCKEYALDCIILEVGLGGRLDPTNILEATLIILTQVALDHTEILGKTRQQIALEKLALLRHGIPLICAEPDPPAVILEKTKSLACPLYQINENFGFYQCALQWDVWFEGVMFCNLPLPVMHLRSLSCAVQVVKILFSKIQLTQNFLSTRFVKIALPARYQKVTYQGIEFVLDVSHNPAGVEALANFLRGLATKPTYAVFGAKLNKDVSGMISLMQNVIQDWYLVPMDGVNLEALANIFLANKISVHTELGVAQAIERISQKKLGDIRVVVFGSFLVAGEMLALVNKKHF